MYNLLRLRKHNAFLMSQLASLLAVSDDGHHRVLQTFGPRTLSHIHARMEMPYGIIIQSFLKYYLFYQ